MPLSVVINTKNAAETLEETLKSVSFADEIVVVDMHSIDGTRKIAKKYTSKVLSFDDIGYVEPARNFAISQAKHDYVLLVDADETINIKLKNKIQTLIDKKDPADVYLIPRKNYIFGQWVKYAGWWPDYQVRLFKKGMVRWSEKIHQQPTIHGQVVRLPPNQELAIEHQNYPSVDSYLQRLNRYTTHQADNLNQGFVQEVSPSSLLKSYFSEFFKRFFVFTGYKDQVVGTGLSLLQAIYEVSVQLKIWELQQKEVRKTRKTNQLKVGSSKAGQRNIDAIRTLEEIRGSMSYWLADWHVKHSSGVSKIIWQIRRKLRL